MKRVLALLTCSLMILSCASMTVHAASLEDITNSSSLDDVVNSNNQEQTTNGSLADVNNTQDNESNSDYVTSEEYIDSLKGATDLSQTSEVAASVNSALNKVVTIIVQILAYGITILLTVKVLLDLLFITIPFTRTFLGNGYAGNAQAGMDNPAMGGMAGMNSPIGGGMYGGGMMGGGLGGYGGMSGGYGGMSGGMYGRGRYGMGGGMMNGMAGGMNGMGAMQPGQQPAMTGRIQWVSNAALNAVAAENVPDGKVATSLRLYAKDMVVYLIATPILLVLAMSGALTELGFLVGDLITQGLAKIDNML